MDINITDAFGTRYIIPEEMKPAFDKLQAEKDYDTFIETFSKYRIDKPPQNTK